MFEYIERKQENNKKDNQYSVEDNETKVFFESKLEASIYINDTYDIDMEDTEKYIQPNYFEKIKNWLSNAFVKIYSNFSDEDFDKRFNQINKIIENQTNDKENKLENKRRNNRRP
ncbi:Stage II sporulation serine phosphatase for sigma-F activation (SpoIIE) [Vibrio chagasii]|nr:Stage II sporulation serine phosphatase for sigma-F activation (SpoIIE) [Vibrio chagasii]